MRFFTIVIACLVATASAVPADLQHAPYDCKESNSNGKSICYGKGYMSCVDGTSEYTDCAGMPCIDNAAGVHVYCQLQKGNQ